VPITSDTWRRIDAIFHEVATVPSLQRAEVLLRLCEGRDDVREEVERLLAADEAGWSFLDIPALGERPDDSPPVIEPADTLVGTRIGSYHITSRIAGGGMGVVYRARRDDEVGDYDVAIKVVKRGFGTDDMLRRFHSERRTLGNLNHPNIARVLDGGSLDDGRPFLVMEFIEGEPIDTYCETNRLTVAQRLELMRKVCLAVHFAHQNLVVHRDLKPSNILVDEHGEPKLLDFGIAKILSPGGGEQTIERTVTEARMLTPEYASPEQILGRPVTTASDIYSLGVILYQLLTGRKPYRLTSRYLDEMGRHVSESAPRKPSTAIGTLPQDAGADDSPPSIAQVVASARQTTIDRLRRSLRGDIDNIVMMALRKEPERRYASAEQLAEDLHRHAEDLPVIARPDTWAYRTSRFIKRHRTGVIAAGLIALTLTGGIISTSLMAFRARTQRDHAGIEAESAFEIANILSDLLANMLHDATPEEAALLEQRLGSEEYRIRHQFADKPHLQANLLTALGNVHLARGDFARAESLIMDARDMRLDEFGADSMEMALSWEAIGMLRYQQGDYPAAAEAFEACLRLHRMDLDLVHTDVGTAANNLAVALRVLGRTDEAEELHRDALAIRRRQHGPDSPDVAESLNNLALIVSHRGDYARAIELQREVLDIRTRILGERHFLTAQSHANLAVLHHYDNDLDRAADSYQRAIAAYRDLGSSGREGLARTLPNYSDLLLRQGDRRAAEAALTEALDIQIDLYGDDHATTASVLDRLAPVENALGRFVAAEVAYQRALRIRRATLPAGHRRIGLAAMNYGVFLTERSRADEAEPLLREAVHIARTTDPEHALTLERALLAHGTCLARLWRFGEAEPLLSEAWSIMKDGPDAQRARDALADLYRAMGTPERIDELSAD